MTTKPTTIEQKTTPHTRNWVVMKDVGGRWTYHKCFAARQKARDRASQMSMDGRRLTRVVPRKDVLRVEGTPAKVLERA